MDRRTMLGRAGSLGLLVAARHAVAQRPVKPFRIGYLSLRAGPNAWDEAFVQRLRESGYRTGDNLLIDYRWQTRTCPCSNARPTNWCVCRSMSS